MDRSNATLEDRLDELEEKIKVDETNISAELISHPHDFYHVARGAADAVSLRDMAKFHVETYESTLYLVLRKELLERGEKFTEAFLEHKIHDNDPRIKLVEKYLTAKHLADRWLALKESFVQKGYMLKEIVDNRKSDNIAEGSYSSQRREALSSFQR
jgi:hypothetical protein